MDATEAAFVRRRFFVIERAFAGQTLARTEYGWSLRLTRDGDPHFACAAEEIPAGSWVTRRDDGMAFNDPSLALVTG